MLVLCYRSRVPFNSSQADRLYHYVDRIGGWAQLGFDYMDLYCPEGFESFLLLIDSNCLRYPRNDYIV